MKYLVLCFFTIFITSNIFSQNLDTTEWIDFKSSDSRFMLKYPSYFKIANWGDRNDDCNSIIDLNYTEYTPLDPNIKSDSVEYPSILSIFTCKKSFNTIAQQSSYSCRRQ